MAGEKLDTKVAFGAPQVLTGTPILLTFAPAKPVRIMRVGMIATVANSGTNTILQCNHQAAGGGALSPSGANRIGNLTGFDDVAGRGIYKDAPDFTGGKPIYVRPGEQFTVAVTTSPTAGSGFAFIEYEEEPMQPVAVARLNGDLTTSTIQSLGQLTKVTL